MDLGLKGAAAVVSGGSKGMGRAAAECLAAEGARVAVLARGPKALEETTAALRRAGSPDAVGIHLRPDRLDHRYRVRRFGLRLPDTERAAVGFGRST